ncbi:hypothetical protein B0H13DRAFT_1926036 [Mycena leptocephala]|nr:hypothetical protein B0H13DRAFT_1926036 [Mycena leptocephala]
MAEKLERLAARLRRPRAKDSQPGALDQLEAVLDAMLLDTDNGNVLPSAVHLPPNKSSSWAQTHASMMPGVKTKRKPLGIPLTEVVLVVETKRQTPIPGMYYHWPVYGAYPEPSTSDVQRT